MDKKISFSVNVKALFRIAALIAIIVGGPILRTIGIIYYIVDILSHYTFKIEKKDVSVEEKKEQ